MHKLLAIFLAVGIVNAGVLPSYTGNSNDTSYQSILGYLTGSSSNTSTSSQSIIGNLTNIGSGSSLGDLSGSSSNSSQSGIGNLTGNGSNTSNSSQSGNVTGNGGDIVSIILKLVAGGASVEFSDVIALILQLQANGNTNAGDLLIGFGGLVGINFSVSDIDTKLRNTPVDLDVILQALLNSGLSGKVDLASILTIVVNSVANLLNLLIAVSGSALAYLHELLSPVGSINVSALLQVLQNLEKAKINTLSGLIGGVANAGLLGSNITAAQLPEIIGNITVNISKIIAGLNASVSGVLDGKGLVAVISLGLNIIDVVSIVLSAPLNLLSVILTLLSSALGGKQVSLNVISGVLRKLGNSSGGIITLQAFIEACAAAFNLPISVANLSKELLNISFNVNDYLNVLTGLVGSNRKVGVDDLILALASVVAGALNVIANIPNVALSLVLSALSVVTGPLNVAALKLLLSGLGSNATLSQIISLLGGNGSSLPSVIGNIRGLAQLLLKLLGGVSGGTISVLELVGLIGVCVPQLLVVTVYQVLSGVVVTVLVGVAGLVSAVLSGLVGGSSGLLGGLVTGILGGANGGLFGGLLGGLLGGAGSVVGSVTGSVGESAGGSILSGLLGGANNGAAGVPRGQGGM